MNPYHSGQCTYALRFPSGDYAMDPKNWMKTTKELGEAHLWIWLSDESPDKRNARISEARERMTYPIFGSLSAVRAR